MTSLMAVPKIIHQFWDRPVPPPDVAERMASWRKHHPDWRYIKWDDDSAALFIRQEFGRRSAQRFLACTVPAMRADVLRIAAMARLGGMYADVDLIARKPLDELASQQTLLYGRGRLSGDTKIKNGFLIDAPAQRLFLKSWQAAMENIETEAFDWEVSRMTGPMMLSRVWRKKLGDDARAAYRLMTRSELTRFVGYGGNLNYLGEEGHWLEQARARRLVDFSIVPNRMRAVKRRAKEDVT